MKATVRIAVIFLFLLAAATAGAAEPYVRLEDGEATELALEAATRTLRPADGKGPEIRLVGAVHVADASFFSALQEILDGSELVLFESVKPSGAGTRPAADAEAREAKSKARLSFLAGVLDLLRSRADEYPADLDELRRRAAGLDPRLGSMVIPALEDAIGREIRYERVGKTGFRITIRGTTLRADEKTPFESLRRLSEESRNTMQHLAKALGLAYQTDSLDYARPNWRVSDMSMDEVREAVEARGGDFEGFRALLEAGGPAEMAMKELTGLLEQDPATAGMFRGLVKVMAILMLSEPGLAQSADAATMDPAVAKAIVLDRNGEVLRDLEAVLAEKERPKTISIFYGAGHLEDLENRICERYGYVPGETRWIPAIRGDLSSLPIPTKDASELKDMLRGLIEGLKRARPR